MRILLDCDGVIADMATAYLAILNRLTGRNHTVADITSWHFHECVASRSEDAAVWQEIDRKRGFCRDLREYPGAGAFLAKLRSYGEVVAVTAPQWNDHWPTERVEWLRARGFSKDQIVLCHAKSLVEGDILIDDSTANVRAYAAAHPDRQVALLDRPWNQAEPGSWVNEVRCLSYQEALAKVSKLARRAS